jgi:hypothetical protein
MMRVLLLAGLPALGCAGSPPPAQSPAPQGATDTAAPPLGAPADSHLADSPEDTRASASSLDALDAGAVHEGSDPQAAAVALAKGFGAITMVDASTPDPQAQVHPRLPPVVIQQVIRAHFAAFRHCYEDGQGRNPRLAGMVSTKIVIGRDGAVSDATLVTTTMPDPKAVDCIVDGYRSLHFPAPTGGVVTVVYPIQFNPD